ncbi:hypothetical protein Tco_0344772 [Tanacetum coccineum]
MYRILNTLKRKWRTEAPILLAPDSGLALRTNISNTGGVRARKAKLLTFAEACPNDPPGKSRCKSQPHKVVEAGILGLQEYKNAHSLRLKNCDRANDKEKFTKDEWPQIPSNL